MVSSGFNFASYKSAFGNTPQMGIDKEVSQKSKDDLALNSMMDHGIENQAISNVVQGKDHATAINYCSNFRSRNHMIWSVSYTAYQDHTVVHTIVWFIGFKL